MRRNNETFSHKWIPGYSVVIVDNGLVWELRLIDTQGNTVDSFDLEKMIPVGAVHSSFLNKEITQDGDNKGTLLDFIVKHNDMESI